MKHIIISILFFLPLFCFGQKKAPPTTIRQSHGMEGVGRFKINKTTLSFMSELAIEFNTTIQKSSNILRMSQAALMDSSLVFEIVGPVEDPTETPFASICSDVRVFYIPTFTASDIKLEGIDLSFYKGILIEITTEYSDELNSAFEIKYGPPKLNFKENIKNCVFINSGGKTSHKGSTITRAWHNGNLRASSYMSKQYDNDCKPYFISFFSILDEAKIKAKQECEAAATIELNTRQQAERRRKLSDL